MSPDHKQDDGALVAMEQVGQWVRYADTKAGLVAAGFAAVLVLVVRQVGDVVLSIDEGGWWAAACLALGSIAGVSALVTLWFLVDATVPRPGGRGGCNRFAWPSLSRMGASSLHRHLAGTSVSEDAWAQALVLAGIAQQKYRATFVALVGFMTFAVSGTALVAVARAAAVLAAS